MKHTAASETESWRWKICELVLINNGPPFSLHPSRSLFSLLGVFTSTKLIFHVGLCTSSHRAFPLNYYAIYKNQPIPVYHFLGLKTSCVRCVFFRCVRFTSVLFLACALLAFDLDSDFLGSKALPYVVVLSFESSH